MESAEEFAWAVVHIARTITFRNGEEWEAKDEIQQMLTARDAAIRAECAEKLHEVMLQKLHINFPTRMLGATAQYYHDEFEKQFQVYRAAIMAEPPKDAL